MSATQISSTTDSVPVLELKSSSVTLPVLKLLRADLEAVSAQLANTIQQAPDFFHDASVIIDLQPLASTGSSFDLALFIGVLRSHNLLPLGVKGGNENQNEAAHALGLAIFTEGSEKPIVAQNSSAKPITAQETGRLVHQPVRSGQRVYAAGGDLIVLASVSPGAELMADGNIHVYGTLRGRALAGVKGNLDARIFCTCLKAELVSISGHYRISESIDQSVNGQSVQIYLDEESIIIEAL